jgi:hypothetical protein
MFSLLLSIGALTVSPRHRHSLTLSAPMPHSLIVCVIYVDFCTGVSLCIASNYTCFDYLFYRVAHISRTHLGYWAWEHSVRVLGIAIDLHGLLQSANPKKKATLDWGIQQSRMK